MTDFVKRYKPYLLLLLVVIVGYWQITFLVYSLKWDNIDVVFPFRHYFSQCIQSGYFPFWNPFQQTGTPFFSDLQAPTYSPELLFISLFTTYGIYTMHFLFVAYAFIAGLGMYHLSMYFNKNSWASLIAAVAYSFNGFIVGHGQHMFLLIGAAWLPFVIKNYLELNVSRSKLSLLKTAIFVFLMISSAYQAMSIVLIYLLLLLFLYYIIKEAKQKDYKAMREILLVNVYLFLIVVIFSLPLIVSTLEVLPFVERFEHGVSIGRSISQGQGFESLKSFLLPFSTIKEEAYLLPVNFSYRNHYFGIISLLFFIAGLYKRRTVVEYVILAYGLVVFASIFESLPVREFMIEYVPLMNLFLAASYTRVFGLFAFILLSANYMARYQQFSVKEKRNLLVLCGITLVLFCVSLLGSEKFSIDDLKNAFAHRSSLVNLINNREVHQHLPLQEMIQLVIMLVFTALVVWQKKIKISFQLILILSLIELFLATQFNMSTSVVDIGHSPHLMKRELALYPKGFPIPINDKVIYNEKDFMTISGFGRNSCIFSKQVSFESFSSFKLKSYEKLFSSNENLKEATLNNHLFYFSDSIFSLKQFSDSSINPEFDNKHLFFSDEDFKILSQKEVATSIEDEIKIVEFSPNNVVIETNTQHDQFLTMLQTNFKGWKAFVDNDEIPIYTSNYNYRTIFLPEGNHTVRYSYTNNRILVLYIVSSFFFFLTLLFIAGNWIYNKNSEGKWHWYIPIALFLIVAFLLAKHLTSHNENPKVQQIYKERWKQESSLYSFKKGNENNRNYPFHIKQTNRYYPIVRIDNTEKQFSNGTVVVTAKISPKSYLDVFMVSSVTGNEEINKWRASNFKTQIDQLNQWNDLVFFRNFYNLNVKDTLNVYLWNPNMEDFLIKDISINIYPQGN